MQFKLKGRTRAELEAEDYASQEAMDSTTEIRQVIYKISWHGEKTETRVIPFLDDSWEEWNRVWENASFDVEYVAQYGRDVVNVSTKGERSCTQSLMVAFVISYFCHPAQFKDQIESIVLAEARQMMHKGIT
mmetsp:Transcript_74477/g.137370  ORF Transcript_74477/g.137370 Transcript_74477/m.137370 type:complete len:132 (+) Transcript_74477:437-832(+)